MLNLVGLALGYCDDHVEYHDEDHGDDVGDDVDAGGDSFNETSFFAQPCRTRTWKPASQPKDTVQIC